MKTYRNPTFRSPAAPELDGALELMATEMKVTDANGCTGISATYTLVIACQTITVTNPATTTAVYNTALSAGQVQSLFAAGVGGGA